MLSRFHSSVLTIAACLASFAGRAAVGQDVVINEFVANNDGALLDADGDPSDWFEVYNAGIAAVDLDGWGVTDQPGFLRKWVFPAVTLDPGAYLVVFASGKDRRNPAAELHANFGLSGSGEYFALSEPDGITIAWEFSPSFPPQREGFSYGLSAESAELVTEFTPLDVLVPTNGTLGTSWTATGFVPSGAWTAGTQGVGYYRGGGASAFPPAVAYWDFDGNTTDQTGNGHDGSYDGGGGPTYVEGADGSSGGALQLGTGYLDVITGAELPIYNEPAYTISMWVNAVPQSDNRIFSEGSDSNNSPLFTIGTDNNGGTGAVDIFIRDGSGGTVVNHAKSVGDAFDGTWHHVAWVDQGGNADLYIDGVLDATNFDYNKTALPLDITAIGAVLRSTVCCQIDGLVDDFAIWDEALSVSDIQELALGSTPTESNPYARHIDTDVATDMDGVNSSAYVRLPFQVSNVGRFDRLTLRTRYDDGFVAYLNGVEIARGNAPGGTPSWNATATAERDPVDATAIVSLDVSASIGALQEGDNVLALHGLNRSAGDEEFLLSAELLASSASGFSERYFQPATPGAPNGTGVVDFVADTVFSHDRGFHEAPILVEITTATPGATIRYTTDQEWPTASSGNVYTGPILVDTTTTLRAAAFRPGFRPSNTDTQTYIFLEDVIRQSASQPGYPTTWTGGFPADYAVDPNIALDSGSPDYSPTIKSDLQSLPVLSLTIERDDLMGSSRGIYTHSTSRGSSWERPASMEFFHPDGSQADIQVNCGVRMQGGSSARAGEGKHSFRLLFKGDYGPTKLRYKLFPDSTVDTFDTVVLRCFSTDSWHFKDGGARYRRWDSQFIRDLFMKDSQLDMGQPSGHNVYVHLYVNGMYWGVYNPSERPDDDFNASHHGGEDSDWDIIKDFNELFRGNRSAWSATFALANGGLSSTAAYQRIQGNNSDGTRNPAFPIYVDVANITDYMILHLYGCAEDWPHHNWYAGRDRTGASGGWKFYVWDQEITMDFQFRDRTGVNNDQTPARLYSALRANEDYRILFADHVHRHFFNDGALTIESARARWMERATQIDRAVIGESARWGDYRQDVRDPSNSPAELYTRSGHWVPERDTVIDEYIPDSHRLALARFQNVNLYPDVSAPVFSQHGGRIEPGFDLGVTAAAGTIYYTVDGSDPRLPGGAVSPTALQAGDIQTEVIVAAGAACRVLVPTGPVSNWNGRVFNDAAWISTTTGVGFERGSGYEDLLGEDLGTELDGVNATAYIRIPFTISDPTEVGGLVLRMKYDDGFIAYINGSRVAAANDPEDPIWSSGAADPHADAAAVQFETFDLAGAESFLVAGTNILAIQGMNTTASSSDMLILPELVQSVGGTSGIPLDDTTLVRSRAFVDEWSALNEALFHVDVPLRITEIMYHPRADGDPLSPYDRDDYEFLELLNIGDRTIDLRGFRLRGGIEYDFSTGVDSIAPGEVMLVVGNLIPFIDRYPFLGVTIAGEYRRNLGNSGDSIRLEGPLGEPILDFAYADTWYPQTDGLGSSLVILDPLADPFTWGEAASWTFSTEIDGNPGFVDFEPPAGGLQLPGNSNQDNALDLSDAVRTLFMLFSEQAAPPPCQGDLTSAGNIALIDMNGDAAVNLTDPVYLLNFLFLNGPAPSDGLTCRRIEGCPDACP